MFVLWGRAVWLSRDMDTRLLRVIYYHHDLILATRFSNISVKSRYSPFDLSVFRSCTCIYLNNRWRISMLPFERMQTNSHGAGYSSSSQTTQFALTRLQRKAWSLIWWTVKDSRWGAWRDAFVIYLRYFSEGWGWVPQNRSVKTRSETKAMSMFSIQSSISSPTYATLLNIQ